MDAVNVQFLIPTCNNAQEIDATLQSIWLQEYALQRIFVTVMDFGSTDGTYEKLLGYDRFQLGIYQERDIIPRSRWITHMARIVDRAREYAYPAGAYCLTAVLYPGDVLYPSYVRICADTFVQYQGGVNPGMLICETDCQDDNGKTIHQPPLFLDDCIIDSTKQFICRGYQHQVQCMGLSLRTRIHRFSDAYNEQRWWNKLRPMSGFQNAIYIKEPLLCQKKITYDDEFEEIELRWESVVSLGRLLEDMKHGNINTRMQMNVSDFDSHIKKRSRNKRDNLPRAVEQAASLSPEANIAEYALWRSWLLCHREGPHTRKDAEDCFLISRAISPAIAGTELFGKMQRYVMEREKGVAGWLEEYFATHGMN